MSLMSMKLTQRTIDHLGYLGFRILLFHTMRDTSVDIRYFQSLDTIVGDVGHEIHIVDVKLSVFLTFRIDLTEEFDLCIVKMLAHLLYHPDITEEFCTQVTISHHRLTNHTQVGIDQFDDFVLWTDFARCHLVKLVAQTLQLTLDDCIIDLFFGFEISVECTSPLA